MTRRHRRAHLWAWFGGGVAVVAAYLAVFVEVGGFGWTGYEPISLPVLLMLALGACAIVSGA